MDNSNLNVESINESTNTNNELTLGAKTNQLLDNTSNSLADVLNAQEKSDMDPHPIGFSADGQWLGFTKEEGKNYFDSIRELYKQEGYK